LIKISKISPNRKGGGRNIKFVFRSFITRIYRVPNGHSPL
jgi:hypothetical protein